jgi:MobA/VirD2-like, nuclease domain
MILKASQRGGGKQLALHLMRTDDNEHVEVHEIRGFMADDLQGALKEAYAVSRGTRCKQFLFSVSLNPPQAARVPVETFENAILRIEQRNGLLGQPRIIVFHEKEGRRHAHAVWSRIDAETMTAKNLSHFKLKLRDISREVYLEQGWKMPRGFMNSREADPRNFNLKEWQQARRTGRDPRDLKDLVRECWAVSDSRAGFIQALRARGIELAKGDRRGFVAIAPDGQVLSVARYAGKTAKEVKARLGEPDRLPNVADAKAQLARDLTATFQRHFREAEANKRMDIAPLERRRQAMVEVQRSERERIKERQEQRWLEETKARSARFEKGFRGLWDRLTGKHAAIQKENEREAYQGLSRDRAQRDDLIAAQMKDRQGLQVEITAARTRHAELLRALRQDRQQVKMLAREAGLGETFNTPARTLAKTPTHQERLERLRDQASSEPKTERQLSPQDRLDRLKDGNRTPRDGRDKSPDRER